MRIRITLIFIIVYLIGFCSYSAAGLRNKVNQGNRHYKNKKYEEALQEYRDALIDDPESEELHYNLGDALYKNGNYEEAVKV